MTDDVRTSSIPTTADALELLDDGLALCQQAIGKLVRARSCCSANTLPWRVLPAVTTRASTRSKSWR